MTIVRENFFQETFKTLDDVGVLDVILPFILIYTLVYAVLWKAEIFGAGKKANKINVILAVVLALLFVAPHIIYEGDRVDSTFTSGPLSGYADPVSVINNSVPSIMVWVVIILMFMILTGMAGGILGDEGWAKKWIDDYKPWVAGIALVVIIYTFGVSARFWPNLRQMFNLSGTRVPALFSNSSALAALVFLTIGLIVMWVGGGEDDGNGKVEKVEKTIRES